MGYEIGNGGLCTEERVITHSVDGERHEEEIGFLRIGGNEGTLEKSELECMLAEVIPQFWIEGVWVRKKNVSKLRVIRGDIGVYENL